MIPLCSPVIVDTIVASLVPLLLLAARGDAVAAAKAAMDMLADYRAQSPEELGLAAEIVSFRLKVLKALHDSSLPNVPYAANLELMKAANTLRRGESAAQRKLDALQRARLAAAKAQAAAEAPSQPQPEEPAADSLAHAVPVQAPSQTPTPVQPRATTLSQQPPTAPSPARSEATPGPPPAQTSTPAARPPVAAQSTSPQAFASSAQTAATTRPQQAVRNPDALLSDEELAAALAAYSPGARMLAEDAALTTAARPTASRPAAPPA